MRKRNGFTLIEMLVSLALCAILLFGLIYIFNFTLKLMGSQQQKSLDQGAGLIILSQISKDIRNCEALSIDPKTNALHLTINSQEAVYAYQNKKIAKIKTKSTQYLSDEDQISRLKFSQNNNLISIELDQLMVNVHKRN